MATQYESPLDHINRIRRDEFSLLPDGSRTEMLRQARNLHRAIRTLSKEIYSKQAHFIFELIQNAEDNAYDLAQTPELEFRLLRQDPMATPEVSGALIIINNELGFMPQNVEALCNIGDTTKTKSEGYIGEKGIGFKSVFLVSERPHVFSRGYQFCFSEQPDPSVSLGFIVPYWVDVPDSLRRFHDKTCIVLPLKPDMYGEVSHELEMIAPEIILFLSKLRALTIHLEGREPLQVLCDDRSRPLVSLLAGNHLTEYWVSEADFRVPEGLVDDKRADVTERRVSVACPLGGKQPERSVFAYLPTEVQSGFPFLINADFILSASRESIQIDRPWNLWLRDCIAPTFVDTFASLVQDPTYCFEAYKYIPLEATDPFFEPVRGSVYETLMVREVVWACRGDHPVLPTSARRVTADFRKLLGDGLLPDALQHALPVHPKITGYASQLARIGVPTLSEDEELACLRDDAWMDAHGPDWFVMLYRYLSSRDWVTGQKLRTLSLLLTDDGQRTSVEHQPVYFPTANAKEITQTVRQLFSSIDMPSTPVAFLDARVYEALQDHPLVLAWLRDTLWVKEPTVAQYCLDLAQYLNRNADDLEITDLVHLTAFIRDQYGALDSATRADIKRLMPIALSDGRIIRPKSWDDEHPLVMPEKMDPEVGWQWVFPDAEDRAHMTILSDAYLASCSDSDRESWKSFLSSMGATESPYPRKYTLGYYWNDGRVNNYEQEMTNDILDQFDGGHSGNRSNPRDEQLTNYRPPAWLALLEAGESLEHDVIHRRGVALLRWLNATITTANPNPDYLYIEFQGFYRTKWYAARSSEFNWCLRWSAWLSTNVGLAEPGRAWIDRADTREIMGDSVAYAPRQMSTQVAEVLEVNSAGTTQNLLNYLQTTARDAASEADPDVMRRIYRRLQISPINKGVFDHPLILVTTPTPRWVKRTECVWPDVTHIFGDTYVCLEREYGADLRSFFVGTLGVAAQLDDELYAQAWERWQKTTDAAPARVESAIQLIFPRLSQIARSDEKPAWWDGFCRTALVWTQGDRFAPASRVFIPDDGELRRALRGRVEFAWRPERDSFAEHSQLYEALGVRSLADSITVSEIEVDQHMSDGERHSAYLTPVAKRGICLSLWSEFKREYERLKREGLVEALLVTDEVITDKVCVTFRLDDQEIRLDDRPAWWDARAHKLYLASSAGENMKTEIAISFARRFARGENARRMEDLIVRMLGASDTEVDSFAQRRNWTMPRDEEAWVDGLLSQDQGRPDIDDEEEDRSFTEAGSLLPDATDQEPPATQGGGVTDVDNEVEDAVSDNRDSVQQRSSSDASTSDSSGRRSGGASGRKGTEGGSGQSLHSRTEPPDQLPSWLFSYLVPETQTTDDDDEDGHSEAVAHRQQVDAAGVRHVLDHERVHGRTPHELPHHHAGYDIESIDDQGNRRYIEVKSISGEWTRGSRVGLTSTQFRKARELGARFWLYVVEYALEDDRCHVFAISDPANRVARFYFDQGWQAASEATGETH
jgi:hypothetical protein